MKYLNKIIEYGILLFVFLVPYQARWIISVGQINGGEWEYGTQSLYATEILLAAILVALIIRAMSCWRPKADSIHPSFLRWILSLRSRMTTPAGAVLLFLIYAGVSVFWSIDKNTALIHWRFLVEMGVIMLVVGAFVETRYIASHKIYWAIILSALLQVGFAVGQSNMQYIPASTELGMASQQASNLGASVVETINGRWLRAYGTFPHPNILGGWLTLSLILTIRKIQDTRNKIQTLFLYSSFVIILFGLLLTFSRAAWLAFGVCFIFWFFSEIRKRHSGPDPESRNKKRRWIPAFAGMTIALLTVLTFAFVFPDPFFSRFSSNRLEVKSRSERVASWQEGFEIIKKHPLLGVGVGNYGLAVHRDIISSQPAWYYQPAHNIFLLIWSELGLIGLLLMAYSLWLIAFQLRTYDLGLTTVFLLPLLVLSLFDHYLWSLYPGMMILGLWLILAKKK